ncbi:fimbria/pilus periplasmic chaperone [Enterobacteriaceae bacterium G50]|nr:fimbria/pilus periplasmic chaperone [Enterobacteriaceae bacterium G50]
MKGRQIVGGLFALVMAASTINAYAGGISLGATRIIYMLDSKQTSIPLSNSDNKNVFLVQNWVSDANGKKVSDFVVTPPLFSIQPQRENILRIMYVGQPLPTDRETVFYFNSKAVPAIDKEKLKSNMLQIATQSTIKLFMRPQNLPSSSQDAPATLRCQQTSSGVQVSNPSPYYVTLVQLRIGGKQYENTMVAPKGSLTIPESRGTAVFQTVNDYGAVTKQQTCQG